MRLTMMLSCWLVNPQRRDLGKDERNVQHHAIPNLLELRKQRVYHVERGRRERRPTTRAIHLQKSWISTTLKKLEQMRMTSRKKCLDLFILGPSRETRTELAVLLGGREKRGIIGNWSDCRSCTGMYVHNQMLNQLLTFTCWLPSRQAVNQRDDFARQLEELFQTRQTEAEANAEQQAAVYESRIQGMQCKLFVRCV